MTGSHFSCLLTSLLRPSMVTLHVIITKCLPLPHDPSRNHYGITASTLRLPCVLPCVLCLTLCPASSSHHSCIPCHPAFSCVLLHSPASPCICVLCLLWSRCPQNVLLVPRTRMSLFPSLHLSSLVFQSSAPHSVIRSISPFSLPFHVFSSEATLSWDFLSPHPLFSPLSASLRIRSFVIPLSSLLPSTVSAVVSQSSPPFVTLGAVVCFSVPTLSLNCSYRVPSSWRTCFSI